MKQLVVYLLLAVLLIAGLAAGQYAFSGPPHITGDWIRMASLPAFTGCIFAGRWLCGYWFNDRRPPYTLAWGVLMLGGIPVLWYWLVRLAFRVPGIGFTELSVAYGPLFLLGLTAGFVIKLVRAYNRRQLAEARALAAQKETELQRLRAQIAPHFLFNTLNNLYGIAISDHKRTPGLILKLSELLRYALYETAALLVPLNDELAYIRNYMAFEKMRVSDRLLLEEDLGGPYDPSIRICPMLLIVFVENAFKHSRNTLDKQIHIRVALQVKEGFIRLDVLNSYRDQEDARDKPAGLGLINAVQRLDMQ